MNRLSTRAPVLLALLAALVLVLSAHLTTRPEEPCEAFAMGQTGRPPRHHALHPLEPVPGPRTGPVGAELRNPPGRATDSEQVRFASNDGPGTSQSVRVRGVVRRGGEPVPGYDLVFRPMGQGFQCDDAWDFADRQGRYELQLPPADYLVNNDERGCWTANVTVPSGEREVVRDITLPPGGIHGAVLRDDTREPLAGARVVAVRTTPPGGRLDVFSTALMARAGEARSGPNGAFELLDLRPGDYVLTAQHDGCTTAPVAVTVGESVKGGIVIVSGRVAPLSGSVRGPGGFPVEMELLVYRAGQPFSFDPLSSLRLGRTEPDGSFSAVGLPPGAYRVVGFADEAIHPLAVQASVDLLPSGTSVALTACASGSMAIEVATPVGVPVGGAFLDVRSRAGALEPVSMEWLRRGAVTDPVGLARLDDVLPGSYRVAAGSDGALGEPADVVVRSGETTALRLVLDLADSR